MKTSYKISFSLICLLMLPVFLFSQNVEQGLKAMDNEKYNLAKSIFSSLIQASPNDGMLYYYRGNAYFEIGKKDSAQADFEKGASMTSNPVSAGCSNAGLGLIELSKKNVAGAKQDFTKALSLVDSKDVRVLMAVSDAWISTDTKDLNEGITLLNKALAIDKKNTSILLLLGDAYEQQIDGGGKAVSSYEKALEINPKLAKAYYKIGVLYMRARNNQEALTAFLNCVKADPSFVPVYRELGELYHALHKSAEAKEAYSKYIEMAESNLNTLTRYASFLFLTKDYKGTGNLIDQIMKSDSSNPVLFRLLGYSNFEQGKFPEAYEAMNRFFAKADPQKIIVSDYEYYAKALSKTGRDSLAVVYFNNVIKADTSRGELHGDIAEIYYKQKKYTDAASEYGLKIQSTGPSAADYFLMGKALYIAKQYTTSDSIFNKVIELKPNSHIGYLWRGRSNALIDTNMTTGAAKPFYEKCIEIITSDTANILKYKKELVESYSYLGNYYLQKDDNENIKKYFQKVLEYDPENKDAKKVLDSLKKKK